MRRWFGNNVNIQGALGGCSIALALPSQASFPPPRPAPSGSGIILCGDHLTSASGQGDKVSGANAASAIATAFDATPRL